MAIRQAGRGRGFLFLIPAAWGLFGIARNGVQLIQDFYARPLARFIGYASLLAYALLMLTRARYNTASNPKEEKAGEN